MQAKLTKLHIDHLTASTKDQFVWDTDVKGFGLKVTPQGRKVYVVQYRLGQRSCRYTLGTHGTWTPELARREAQRLLRGVAEGKDPQHTKALKRQVPTFSAFAAQYLSDYAVPRLLCSSPDIEPTPP